MPRYKVRAYNQEGGLVEEVFDAPTFTDLMEKVKEKGWNLVNADEIPEAGDTKAKSEKKSKSKGGFTLFGGVGDRDISLFCRQLGAMVNAGVGIIEALEIVAEQMPNKKLGEATEEVAEDVSQGTSLSDALAKRKNVFPELVINLAAVGEETGELDRALLRASEYYEKIAMIKSKIKSASF